MGGYKPELSESIFAFKRQHYEEIRRHQLHIPEYAAFLNESADRMHKYLNLNCVHRFPADLLRLHTMTLGPELAQTILLPAHFTVVELPRVLPDWKDAMSLAARVTQECAQVLIHLTKRIEDQSMTQQENRELVSAARRAVAALVSVEVTADVMTKVMPRQSEDEL